MQLELGTIAERIGAYRAHAAFNPISERLVRNVYSELLQPGDAAIDVGVHYGIHLLPMAEAVGEAGHAYGIEASAERYEAMLAILAAKRIHNATLIHAAASDREGEAPFFLNRTLTGRSGLFPNPKTEADVIEETRVRTIPLDSLFAQKSGIRFIKIDIEGAEALAILGLRETIARNRPFIVFESHPSDTIEKCSVDPAAFRTALSGYTVFDLFGSEIDMSRLEGGDRWDYLTRSWNFFAVPQEGVASASLALTRCWEQVLAEE